MSCKPALTPQQIQEAKELRKEGYTKVRLAIHFNVGATTIWENVYCEQSPQQLRIQRKLNESPKFRSLVLLVNAIVRMKQEGYNSLEISDHLQMPLKEVNYIFGHF